MSQDFTALKTHIERSIVGQATLVERLLTAVLADGHLLIEGLPGLAKTTAVRALADALDLSFKRIQFTPDLIPGDITGTEIFVPREGRFHFEPGPLFNEVILGDEINRAPPKVQSALLEAMQERQVTAGGESRKLPEIFLVIATQNPIEHEGTYPLPEAQLDRFFMKVNVGYPAPEDELEILRREQNRLLEDAPAPAPPSLSRQQVLSARRQVNAVHMDEMLERYIVALVGATRRPQRFLPEAENWFERGASPRATLALARAARAHAFLRQRDFVEPGDIMDAASDVLNHRVGLTFSARAEGITPRSAVAALVDAVPVP